MKLLEGLAELGRLAHKQLANRELVHWVPQKYQLPDSLSHLLFILLAYLKNSYYLGDEFSRLFRKHFLQPELDLLVVVVLD